MGSAILESSADGTSWVSLWSKSQNMGDQWLQATVYTAGNDYTMLRFVYTSGIFAFGDFALDDIRIGDCLTVGCLASNDCHVSTGCDTATGQCYETMKSDGTSCDAETHS